MSQLDLKWHDLSFRDWIRLWDEENWRERIADTLREIVYSRRASVKDRLLALSTINEAILQKVLAPDPDYPVVMRDVLLDTVIESRWNWFFKRKRKRLHERLIAARWMLSTAYQFGISDDDAPMMIVEEAQPGSATPTKPGTVLS